MENLLEAVTALIADTHPSKIRHLASLIRKNVGEGEVKKLQGWAMALYSKERLSDLFDSWRLTDMGADELAGMLIGASHAYHEVKLKQSIELVWTGPSTGLVATRKTEQVLLEVIGSASKELFLTSFVAYKVESVMKALAEALERGASVSILLESDERHGGYLSVDSIKKMRESLPMATIYYWEKKDGGFIGGKVHAKVVVADANICFISSANLTGHAMEKNMEAGVLIRGGNLPDQLQRHLKAMMTTGLVSPFFLNSTSNI